MTSGLIFNKKLKAISEKRFNLVHHVIGLSGKEG